MPSPSAHMFMKLFYKSTCYCNALDVGCLAPCVIRPWGAQSHQLRCTGRDATMEHTITSCVERQRPPWLGLTDVKLRGERLDVRMADLGCAWSMACKG